MFTINFTLIHLWLNVNWNFLKYKTKTSLFVCNSSGLYANCPWMKVVAHLETVGGYYTIYDIVGVGRYSGTVGRINIDLNISFDHQMGQPIKTVKNIWTWVYIVRRAWFTNMYVLSRKPINSLCFFCVTVIIPVLVWDDISLRVMFMGVNTKNDWTRCILNL